MEIQCPSFQVLLAFFLFMIMVLKIGKIRGKTKYSASNLPPGPWKLPLIGNLHQLAGSLPHHGLRDLAKKYGPLMHLKLGEVSTVVVSSAEFAKEVMKTHDLIFASRPHILATKIMSYDSTSVIFAPYGEYWRQLRKIFTLELLSAKRVRSYRPIREEEVRNLIKSIASRAGSPINLTREIYSSTFTITSRAAFGKETRDQEKFIYIVKEATKAASGFALADVFPSVSLLHLLSGMRPKLERLHKEADRIMGNIIKEHQRDMVTTKSGEGEAEEDLVDVLLKFHEPGNELEFSLTTENIKAVIMALGDSIVVSLHHIFQSCRPRQVTLATMVKGSWVSDAVQLEFEENWDWNNRIQAKREALTANSMVFYSYLDYKSCPYNIPYTHLET